MSQKQFQNACAALWGPVYQSTAARELGLGRSTIVRYDRGDREVPQAVWEKLQVLLMRRSHVIGSLLAKIGEKVA